MRSKVELVPSRAIHVGPIAVRMRAMDVLECAAMGHTPRQALRAGLRASSICLTAMVDGRAEAMIGLVVTNALCGEGTPWMLGTDAIYRHPRVMIRTGAAVIAAMLDSTPSLANVVAVENIRAIRMLRRWGFSIEEDRQVFGSTAFVNFGMERS